VVPDAANPQALNRYSYGLNNPMKFVDPTGHMSSVGGNGTVGGYTPPYSLNDLDNISWVQRQEWLRNFEPTTAHDQATTKWKSFFQGAASPNTPATTLISLWGTAEQAGVDYGTGLAATTKFHAGLEESKLTQQFVWATNIYRYAAINNRAIFPSPTRGALVV